MMKLAVVNISKVLDKSRRARMFAQELQNIAQEWQKKLQVTERLRTQAEEKLSKLTEGALPEQVFSLERERRLFDAELNQMRERSELDLSMRAQRFQAQVAEEIAPLIAEHAKAQSIDAVLSAVGSQVLYSASALDCTDDILKMYDQKYR